MSLRLSWNYRTVIALDSYLIQIVKISPKSRLRSSSSRRSSTVQNPKIILLMATAKRMPCFVSCYRLFRSLIDLRSLVWLPKQLILMTCLGKMRRVSSNWMHLCADVASVRIGEKILYLAVEFHSETQTIVLEWNTEMQISTLFWIVVFWIGCKPTLLSFRWPCKNSQLCTRPTLWSKFTVTWLLLRRGGCTMCLFAKLRLRHNPSWCSPETSRRFGIRGCWNFWTNAGSICRCVWCVHTF